MYKEYFGLGDEPFRMTPDTRYLFRSHRHEEAISSLLYGIGEKKGFIVITGEIGTGKTTLCRTLLNQLDPATKTAVILNPSLSKSELLHAILDDLSIEVKLKNPSQKGLLDLLNAFLIEQARAGGNVAVIIDEAQNLDVDVLESIRMLSNLETEQEKLLQIILVGQPELNEILKMPKLEQLRQRIAVRYHITPLERDEIPKYISHRLLVAGNQKCVEFRSDAIDAIAQYTRGTPRLINIICDKCLLAAYALQTRIIDGRLAETAIVDHEGPQAQATQEHAASYASHAPAASYSAAPMQAPRSSLQPVLAAAVILVIVLLIGISARQSAETASPAALKPPSPVAAPALSVSAPSQPEQTSPAEPAAPAALTELLSLWGFSGEANSIEAAGMSTVHVMADLPTLARINLPVLLSAGPSQMVLAGVSPTSYTFYDPSELLPREQYQSPTVGGAKDKTRVEVSRLQLDASGVIDARIALPASLAYPENPASDPRLAVMLQAAVKRDRVASRNLRTLLRPESIGEAVIAFQTAVGIPVDGIVGPLTWCALVSRTHPDFPKLTP